jgi:hypothetical protein
MVFTIPKTKRNGSRTAFCFAPLLRTRLNAKLLGQAAVCKCNDNAGGAQSWDDTPVPYPFIYTPFVRSHVVDFAKHSHKMQGNKMQRKIFNSCLKQDRKENGK